jgi:hypothetical protein
MIERLKRDIYFLLGTVRRMYDMYIYIYIFPSRDSKTDVRTFIMDKYADSDIVNGPHA